MNQGTTEEQKNAAAAEAEQAACDKDTSLDEHVEELADAESNEEDLDEQSTGAAEITVEQWRDLQAQLEEAQQRTLRAQADFDNFRRRTRQEKEEFNRYAALGLVEQLLPVIDNFERALASSTESQDFDSLAKGIDMVFRQMMGVLEKEGLQQIEAVGTSFNPEIHQAVMRVESAEHAEDTVVEEMQKGYMLKEKVIRPSMVKVSS